MGVQSIVFVASAVISSAGFCAFADMVTFLLGCRHVVHVGKVNSLGCILLPMVVSIWILCVASIIFLCAAQKYYMIVITVTYLQVALMQMRPSEP